MLGEERRDARARQECVDRRQLPPGIGHGGGGGGGFGIARGAGRVASTGTCFRTLKPISPPPFFPMRFISPSIRTTYRVSGFNGCTKRITILSDVTGRCASSLRTSAVSTGCRDGLAAAPRPRPAGCTGEGGGGGGGGAGGGGAACAGGPGGTVG